MIKLGLLHIEEFRGIRELDIELNYESFAIHGPNGSGKSGVVDAIGFALTGTVARLTGAGTRSISVKLHAPHVKSKDDPEAARVSLTFKDLESGQVGIITRTVKDAADYTLSPDTPELRKALENALEHPEIMLSRREIIKFILAEAGKRSEEVQALLQLEKIETSRKLLRSALTKVDADKKATTNQVEATKKQMEVHIEVDSLDAEKVKNAINPKHKLLGLKELESVKLSTNLKEGLEEKDDEKPFNKDTAQKEIVSYEDEIKSPSSIVQATDKLLNAVKELEKSSDLELLKSRIFLETGIDLLDEEGTCPLCDTSWETPEELREHLKHKIESSKEIDRIDKNILSKANNVTKAISDERTLLTQIQKLSVNWSSIEDQQVFQSRSDLLIEFTTLLKNSQGCFDSKDRLEAGELSDVKTVDEALVRLKEKINKQPDTSEKAKASSFLVIAAESWSSFARAKGMEVMAQRASERAKIIYDQFCAVADKELEELYESVESRFSSFYSRINNDDEGGFKAEFKPSAGKLELLVDFYGLGKFPPGAYHSEGHQDGMGICLYLALVEKILGKGFSLSVLDDVVMSVDVNHRRQFCELLTSEFPDTQFIITTHDEIWAKQMKTTGLIKPRADIRFRGWSVDNGPIYEQGKVFWDKINEDLSNDDVTGASHKLRRGLEAELPDIAEALGAKVIYRGDAKYELGELLDAVKARHSELLKKAKESASSWNKQDELEKIGQIDKARIDAALSQAREGWAVNLQVHFNNWADMAPSDFQPVVEAWHDFLELFHCVNDECNTWIAVTDKDGKPESLRCRCGEYNLNLVKKS
ncbi:MAG: AAA family ATPase [Candidatus Saccharimonadales bacterium]